MSLHKNFGSGKARDEVNHDGTSAPNPSPSENTPVGSSSELPKVTPTASPKGIFPPRRPLPKTPTLSTSSLRGKKSVKLPPMPALKRSPLPGSPLVGRNKELPPALAAELQDVPWKESTLPDAGIPPEVKKTGWQANALVPPAPVAPTESFDETAYDLDPNAADPYHKLRTYVKKECPEFLQETPPKGTPQNPEDALVPPAAPAQNTPPVARRNAVEQLPADLIIPVAPEANNVEQPKAPAQAGGTVRLAMTSIKNILSQATGIPSRPASAVAKAPSRPASVAAKAAASVPGSGIVITDGSASTRRREMKPIVNDLLDQGDVQARIDSMRRRTPAHLESEAARALVKIHHVIPETTEALVPEASKTFFGSLFGRYNNHWKNVNEENFVEILGKILQASEDLSKQSTSTIYGSVYFGLAMGIIAFCLFMTRELINKIQNNYSTDKTMTNIVLDYSYSVLLLVTVFSMVGITFAGLRSRAASEEARLNAEELRLWGQTRLRIQVTDEEIREFTNRRTGKAI